MGVNVRVGVKVMVGVGGKVGVNVNVDVGVSVQETAVMVACSAGEGPQAERANTISKSVAKDFLI